MKRQKPGEFTVITDSNIKEIAQRLEVESGIVLIASPNQSSSSDRLTGQFHIHLFGKPRIYATTKLLTTERDKNQTGREHDRKYQLSRKPKPTGNPDWDLAVNFFTSLAIDDAYLFQINFQPKPGVYLNQKNSLDLAIYIPPSSSSPWDGIYHAIKYMTDMWNKQEDQTNRKGFRFTKKHLSLMTSYAVEDLRTSEVLRHNIQAEKNADAMVGLGIR